MALATAPSEALNVALSARDAATNWWRKSLTRRLRFSLTNTASVDLHDKVADVTVPSGIDPESLRVIENTTDWTVERAYGWRYAPGGSSVNNLVTSPASVSGTTLKVKVLGRWRAGETRYFSAYWRPGGAPAAFRQTHIQALAPTWVATVVAGTTGDHYILNMGGATYDYTQIGGDTATSIATGIRALVNAGSIAVASGSAGTINLVANNPRDISFAVTNTGSTTPANLAITKPTFFFIGRAGPDTGSYNTTAFAMGLPFGTGAGVVNSRAAFGRVINEAVRILSYKANGDGTTYGTIDGTITKYVENGPTIDVAGTLTCSTRSGNVDWQGSYTATYYQFFYVGRKSDDTGARTLNKCVNAIRVNATLTCVRAGGYTPAVVAANATSPGNLDILGFGNLDNSFASNVTEAAGNKIANFTADLATGAITSYAINADLTAKPLTTTIIGSHGNVIGTGILVNSLTFNAGWGSQNPDPVWMSQSNAYGIVSLRNLVTSSVIPQNAALTVDFWYVLGITANATNIGDNLLPDELVEIMRNLAATPTASVGAVENYHPDGFDQSVKLASARTVDGIKWYHANALAKTGLAGNYGFAYQVQDGTVTPSDDDDANYGEAYKLAGLCLRYKRLHDASLIPLIEKQVQYHLDVEAAAVAQYGSWWAGAAPYWIWPSPTPSNPATTALEGGCAEFAGDTAMLDPGWIAINGNALGPITYTQGQCRRKQSIDQSHMVGLGLYHYLYLLQNETAITSNTALRTAALNYLSRMVTFETKYSAGNRTLDNLYAICSGGTPTNANGVNDTHENPITVVTLANPYWGTSFGGWNVSNTDGQDMNSSANSSLDALFRSIYAPNTVMSGVRRFLLGRAMDMLSMDIGQHDSVRGAGLSTRGAIGPYRHGWQLRPAASGNDYKYAASRSVSSNNGGHQATDLHYHSINDGGAGDHFSGRGAQRLAVLCMLALVDPTQTIPVEQSGTTTRRSVPVVTAVEQLAETVLLFGCEPITKAQRYAALGYFGKSGGYDDQIADSAYTGYAMFAYELFELVRQRQAGYNLLADYYRLPGY